MWYLTLKYYIITQKPSMMYMVIWLYLMLIIEMASWKHHIIYCNSYFFAYFVDFFFSEKDYPIYNTFNFKPDKKLKDYEINELNINLVDSQFYFLREIVLKLTFHYRRLILCEYIKLKFFILVKFIEKIWYAFYLIKNSFSMLTVLLVFRSNYCGSTKINWFLGLKMNSIKVYFLRTKRKVNLIRL